MTENVNWVFLNGFITRHDSAWFIENWELKIDKVQTSFDDLLDGMRLNSKVYNINKLITFTGIMMCEKCGKVDPSKEVPLCSDCESIHD